jgi:enoyl-CoA hydratase/carnithine racemase
MAYVRSATEDGNIRILTLDRPEVLNATSMAAIAELDALLTTAEQDPAIGCVVLTGAGDKAFCAGNDIHEIVEADTPTQAMMAVERKAATWHWATSAVPTIAAINGVSYGNGTILAVCSDLRVGGPNTRIKVTATSYGSANLTWNLPELIGWAHAKDILLTGRVVGGEEAYRMGLLNRFAADGDVLGEALALARSVAGNPHQGVRRIKQLIHDSLARDLEARFDRESSLELDGIAEGQTDGVFDAFTARSRQRRATASPVGSTP